MRLPPVRVSLVLFVVSVISGAVGCGSRSALLDAGPPEAGGAGGTTTTGTTTSTTTTTDTTTSTSTTTITGMDACATLLVQPTFVLPPTSGVVTKPRTALLVTPGDVVLSALVTPPGGGTAQLVAGRLDAFATWPPAFTDVTQNAGVIDYELGPGANGPVALVQYPGSGAFLVEAFYPSPSWPDAPSVGEADDILFVMGIEDRDFYARSSAGAGYDTLAVGSYQPGGLPQSEQPLACVEGPLLGAAIGVNQGFLAAFTTPGLPGNTCDPSAPKPGTYLSLDRYDSPVESGSLLKHSQGLVLSTEVGEAFVHVGLAPASSGAWLVFQADGSTALTPPPIFAYPLDAAGLPASDSGELFEVAPGGYIPPEVAVASLGDTLAVAWVDVLDPSAPTIQIQLLRPDGSKGAAVGIPTQEAWLSGGLRLLASPEGNSLLVSWAGQAASGVAAVARVDCAGSP